MVKAQNTSTEHQNGSLTQPILLRPRAGIKQAHQAAALQRFAFDAAMALRESCTDQSNKRLVMDARTAKALKDIVSAWETAAERLRILRGKGLPASVKTKTKTAAATVQPLD